MKTIYSVQKEYEKEPIYFSTKRKAINFIESCIGHNTTGMEDLTIKDSYKWVHDERKINQILHGNEPLIDVIVYSSTASGYYFGSFHIKRIDVK